VGSKQHGGVPSLGGLSTGRRKKKSPLHILTKVEQEPTSKKPTYLARSDAARKKKSWDDLMGGGGWVLRGGGADRG